MEAGGESTSFRDPESSDTFVPTQGVCELFSSSLLEVHIWRQCRIMEVEASKVQDCVYHKGRLYSRLGCSEGSDMASPTISRLLDEETNRPSIVDHILQLSERNTPHSKSNLSREAKTYWGVVSSYPGARNRREAWSSKDRHRLKHCWFPDEATLRTTLQNTQDNDGTMTSDWAEGSRSYISRGLDIDYTSLGTVKCRQTCMYRLDIYVYGGDISETNFIPRRE